MLAILLGAPLLAALLYFLGETGAHAWLYCWLFTSGFSIVLSLVFPTWIMPLFNKFEPLEDGELKSTIFDYSRSATNVRGVVLLKPKRSSITKVEYTLNGRSMIAFPTKRIPI